MNAWARPSTLGTPSHNLHVERYHRTIKGVLKPSMNIARFCIGLKHVNKIFVRKDLVAKEGIRGVGQSKIQSDLNKDHPSEDEMARYSLERIDDRSVNVIKQEDPNGEKTSYLMKKNRFPCNSELCQVRCRSCNNAQMCAHTYTCICRRYAYRNLCKHVHILASLETNKVQQDGTRERNTEAIGSDVCNLLTNENDQPIQVTSVDESIDLKMSKFLGDCSKVKEKVEEIEVMLTSDDMTFEEKRTLMENFRSPFASILNTTNVNLSSFPRLSRKRIHEPQSRVFFPVKTAKPAGRSSKASPSTSNEAISSD
ncbi:uncharacterized protein LOC131891643 [Tigriopus californicus]|uniref:uncharacterized protein LOC131891643 n=1 Tax=Tigriopus californicus TaxID=6832 RepID=UPI0027DA63BE|nr:uncharacterized protein LOC131891643 [Tigriopus californicus]